MMRKGLFEDTRKALEMCTGFENERENSVPTKRLLSNDALLMRTKHGILSVQHYSLNSIVIVLFLVFMHSTSLAPRCFFTPLNS